VSTVFGISRAVGWYERASCLGVDPELFFPVGTTGPALDQVDEARRVCRDCPVRRPCLDLALRTDAEYGVWGGFDPLERKRLSRRMTGR
jgi:WhiB family redox-sensing transcriptional regulator